jgi:tRNA (adenine22-N1)-methyltransferase
MIYDQLQPGLPVWDVCCDHGHVGLWAYVSKQFPEIHFVDQAAHLVKRLEELYQQRLGPGPWQGANFHPVAGQQVAQAVTGNLVIAGVGGITVREIIEGLDKNGKLCASRLVLSPHGDENFLQESPALVKNYAMHSKECVQEKTRERPIFVYSKIR